MLHPSVKILSVLFLAAVVNLAEYHTLLFMAAFLILLLFGYRVAEFFRMLRRVRWILLSLLLVYAFSTPGEFIAGWPVGWWTPTYEGLQTGAIQLIRLCVMLAGLSILLATTDRQHLIAGFYLLLRPLQHVRLQPERFAARLMLTLYYVEHKPEHEMHMSLWQRLAFRHDDLAEQLAPQVIELSLPSWGWRDIALLISMLAIGVYLL